MELDILDAAVLGAIALALVYFVYKKLLSGSASSGSSSSQRPRFVVAAGSSDDEDVDDGNFVSKMKKMGANIVIFYGSQTGTAEDFSVRLARDGRRYGLTCLVADIQDYEMNQLEELKEIENAVAIFCVATYGEGEPTDNAQAFYEFLQEQEDEGGDFDIGNAHYAVFGLGNKTYDNYNVMGKYVDRMLEKLGGTRLLELGLGDDDANMEEDFVNWRDLVWPAVCNHFGVDPTDSGVSFRQYELVDTYNRNKIFTGEPAFYGSYNAQRRPFTQKNPFKAAVSERRELYDDDDRSCLHIELNIAGSALKYAAGDHVAVLPGNNPASVDRIAERLSVDLDTVIYLKSTDHYSKKRTPFPCPCSYRTAFTYYVDLCALPGLNILQELVQYAADDAEKERLRHLTTKEGRKEFSSYVHDSRRTILQVLGDFKSVSIPADHLLELLPRMQPRYYSISSSPRKYADKIHVTAAVVRYTAKGGHAMEGVATTWLDRLNLLSEKVPIFLRRSTFRLPKPTVPVIMVGPGTGIAPFRGFLQDRKALKDSGKEIGKMVLFFGCQHESKHFMYREELEEYVNEGVLSNLFTAFSRDGPEKVYVQHLMEKNSELVGELIQAGANIYVCGDAKGMAKDVHRCLVKILKSTFKETTQAAEARLSQMADRRRFQQDVWS